ncbi:MAG: hypothetical protein J6W55_07350 [Acidaminococcaceae bacterium]|nr:hypothetical protein [Acidaminococcaceae bacterium]
MRKSARLSMAVMCATLTLLSVTDVANAASKTLKNTERSVANWYWSDEGEVWPPVAGRYERKNDNGVTNAYINVTVLPDQWPVVTLRACDYNGTDDEKGWEVLSQAPAVVLGGQIIGLAITDSPPNKKYIKAGMKPVQLRLGTLFATGAEVLGIHRGNGTGTMLDDVQIQLMHAGVKSEKDGLVLDYFGHNGLALPDVRGKYVLNKNRTQRADEFAACALVAALPVRETNTDFTDKTLQIIPEAVTGSMMPRYKYIIKNYGFAVKVFQNGKLLRTFMVPKDLSAVYRFDSDGGDVMIYNIDGSKG